MTTGDPAGTSGWRRDDRRAWFVLASISTAVVFVNATSGIIEGQGEHWIEPIFWEVSSAGVILALAPLIGQAIRRWPPQSDQIATFALIHFALTIPFSLVHILLMFAIRETGYAAVGGYYGFFDDGVVLTLIYEWRKDVLVYAGFAAIYWVFQFTDQRAQPAPPVPAQERIELRDGAGVVFLSVGDISHIEAAGNYVEVHTAEKRHLVRGALAGWETRLATAGFIRIHRSRLVNRAKITALRPTASGDFQVTLADGRILAGSRRYRDRVSETAST